MSLKGLLIDLDGTLCEAVSIHFDALNMALKEVCGIEILKNEEGDFNGLPTTEKLNKLSLQDRVDISKHNLIAQRKQELTKKAIIKNLHLDSKKIELHKYTKSLGIKSVCVTNSITETAELMLRQTGQWEYMEFLISNQMVRYSKPHPEGFIIAMVKLGLEPSECMIIEDSERGVEAAKQTGCYIWKVSSVDEVNLDNFKKQLKVISES